MLIILLVAYTLVFGAILTPLLDAIGAFPALGFFLLGWFALLGVGVHLDHGAGLTLQGLVIGAREGIKFFGYWLFLMTLLLVAGLAIYLAVLVLG